MNLPGIIIVGTNPPRPHFLSDHLRVEVWSGPGGSKVPVIRLRNEQCGSIAVLNHEELTNVRNQIEKVLAILESGAAVEAKGALDGIVASFKAKPKKEDGSDDSAS